MSELRIAQYIEIIGRQEIERVAGGRNYLSIGTNTYRYQNYFVGQARRRGEGSPYVFVPFKIEGTTASIGGDNSLVQLLLPNTDIGIRLVEINNGNRKSRMTLTTVWLNETERETKSFSERFIGLGASFSETTIELRFRSAVDSVGSNFPARTLTRRLAGVLPLNSDLRL